MSWIAEIARKKKPSGLAAITRYRKATEAMTGKEWVDNHDETVKEYEAALAALIMELPNQD